MFVKKGGAKAVRKKVLSFDDDEAEDESFPKQGAL
jgi:hypothetical protein